MEFEVQGWQMEAQDGVDWPDLGTPLLWKWVYNINFGNTTALHTCVHWGHVHLVLSPLHY